MEIVCRNFGNKLKKIVEQIRSFNLLESLKEEENIL